MTEYEQGAPGIEIKEQVIATGYIDKDGRFVPVEESASKAAFVQTGEDIVQ